jgi:hypothetical protein
LTFTLYGWSEYLEPSGPKVDKRTGSAPAAEIEAFRTTPAPPVTEAAAPENRPAVEQQPPADETAKVSSAAAGQTQTPRRRPKKRKTEQPTIPPREDGRTNSNGVARQPFGFFNWR